MRMWISFDLGVQGEYASLYRWLDDHDARECGDDLATFETRCSVAEITNEIESIVGKEARIYLVCREATKLRARFVLGKRQRAPWAGYGAKAVGGDVDEE